VRSIPKRVQATMRQASSVTVGASATGINRWWPYEEAAIPGIGKSMLNVATVNLIV